MHVKRLSAIGYGHFAIDVLNSSIAIILTIYLVYNLAPYYQEIISEELHFFSFHFTNRDAVHTVFAAYSLLLLFYYLTDKNPQLSKSIYCLRAIKRIITNPFDVYHEGLPTQERLGLLTILLKAFFAPLMVAWLIPHMAHMIDNGFYLATHLDLLQKDFLAIFNYRGYWFLFQLILTLDVFSTQLVILLNCPD